MLQCAARQFENELVERLSILADRHLRPPAPEGGTVSRGNLGLPERSVCVCTHTHVCRCVYNYTHTRHVLNLVYVRMYRSG